MSTTEKDTSSKAKRIKDFLPALRRMYPDLPEEVIKRIINFGCFKMMDFLKDNDDILIESSRKKVKLLVYKHKNYWDVKKKCRNQQ